MIVVNFSDGSKNVSDQEIVLKDLPQRKVFYLLCKGPWRQLPDMILRLSEYASQRGIETVGHPSGFFYNSPPEVGVQDLTWEVCYTVGSNASDYADDQSRSGVREIPAKRVAAIIHQGSYRKASLSYKKLRTWIEERRLRVSGPGEELYLTDINETNEQQRIEIRLPVSTT